MDIALLCSAGPWIGPCTVSNTPGERYVPAHRQHTPRGGDQGQAGGPGRRLSAFAVGQRSVANLELIVEEGPGCCLTATLGRATFSGRCRSTSASRFERRTASRVRPTVGRPGPDTLAE